MRRPEGLVSHGSPPVCGLRRRRVRLRELLAELLRLSLPVDAHHPTSIDGRDEPLETNTRGRRRLCERGDRRGAAGSETRRNARSAVVSARAAGRRASASSAKRIVVGAALDREAPLAGRRQHRLGREPLGDDVLRGPAGDARPPRGRAASNSPSRTFRMRVSTLPRMDRTSRFGPEPASWAERRRLLVPTTAPSRDRRASRASRATRQSRTSSRARHRADDDAVRVLGRQILERVHGEVDLAFAKRSLELGGEEALPADLGKRLAARLRAIAGGRDHPRLALEARTRPAGAR